MAVIQGQLLQETAELNKLILAAPRTDVGAELAAANSPLWVDSSFNASRNQRV